MINHPPLRRTLALLSSLPLLACGGDTVPASSDSSVTTGSGVPSLTYHRDARAIIESKCNSCHVDGAIAPFALSDFESVTTNAGIAKYALDHNTMPPWPPVEGCNEYTHNRSLSAADRETLIAYFDGEMAEGDPADYTKPTNTVAPIEPDLTVKMSKAYTPLVEPDDHRCFIIDWPETETKFLTGYQVVPGKAEVVHHVIVFKVDAASAADFRAMDEAEAGPGYECFAGPAASGSDSAAQAAGAMIAAWVPGAPVARFPTDSGIRMEPGSVLVMQMHYNTQSSNPAPDQTSLQLEMTDQVTKPGVAQIFTKFNWLSPGGMPIPAGDDKVTLEADIDVNQFLSFTGGWTELGLEAGSEVAIHGAGLHMHQLGKWSRASVSHGDGSESCLIEIDDWDFNWQGQYKLLEPVKMNPTTDTLHLACRWDNSAENQPFIDGKQAAPKDVEWGDDTNDEMCLTALFITKP